MKRTLPRWTPVMAVVVGAMDAATGIGLVAAPHWTLSRMGIVPPGSEALDYVRFVGVFVAAVGLSYGWAWLRGSENRLRMVLEFTLLFRAGAGTFTAMMVLAGGWPVAWLAVSVTDLGLVLLQGGLLAKYRDE